MWAGFSVTPTTFTIGDGTTATVTVTNTYVREFGSLTVAKVVSGNGYIGEAEQDFTVEYECGSEFTGSVTVADGGSVTITGLPARVACRVTEVPPASDLLEPAYAWGTPTWSPSAEAVVPADGTTTLDRHQPDHARLRSGEGHQGGGGCDWRCRRPERPSTSSSTAARRVCSHSTSRPARRGRPLTSRSGARARSPRILRPVAWSTSRTRGRQPPPAQQVVTITSSGEVIAVTVTNTVVRVAVSCRSPRRRSHQPASSTRPGRSRSPTTACTATTPPIDGTVTVMAGADGHRRAVPPQLGVHRDRGPATSSRRPSAADPSWVWLPVTFTPSERCVVTSSIDAGVGHRDQHDPATHRIVQRDQGRRRRRARRAATRPAPTFGFEVTCTPAGHAHAVRACRWRELPGRDAGRVHRRALSRN